MMDIESTALADIDCQPKRTTHIHYQYIGWYSSNRPIAATGGGWTPPVDLYETLDECVVEVNLGGIPVEDVHIDFDDRTIHLTGQRSENRQSGIRCYHVLEIERGGFERFLELPSDIDPKTVKASHNDGLLVIRVTKKRGGTLPGCFPADSMEGLE